MGTAPRRCRLAEEEKKKKGKVLWIITAIFLAIAIAAFLLWFFVWRFEVTTDDAYVHGNQVIVTPQVAGYIDSISVDDTAVVEQGRVLVKLNKIDPKLGLESAKNTMAETVREVSQMFQNVDSLKADLEAKLAQVKKTGQDYKHRKALVKSGAVSKEEFQHSEAFFVEAFANFLATKHSLKGAQALIENTTIATHPLVERAKDSLREAYVNLSRCKIRAPVSGMVAMKKAQVGEAINPNTPLMMVVPLHQIWVDANFKETQLKKVRIGQAVTLKSDMYGRDVIYHGKVIGIAAATGSVMSVLPPQNATGNWIKIVQRLPVRIQLQEEELERHPLRLGLSMDVKVDIRDTSGKMIPSPPPRGPKYSTDVFDRQESGVELLIQNILEKNGPGKSTDR